MKKITVCKRCGRANPRKGNFCLYCGVKLRSTCFACHFDGMPRDCGHEKCPDFKTYIKERLDGVGFFK